MERPPINKVNWGKASGASTRKCLKVEAWQRRGSSKQEQEEPSRERKGYNAPLLEYTPLYGVPL